MSTDAKRVWIVQCLCPCRHCILAAAFEASNDSEVEQMRDRMRNQVEAAVETGAINPWCGICLSRELSYEAAPTRFRTLEEARPHLAVSESTQAAARALFGVRN